MTKRVTPIHEGAYRYSCDECGVSHETRHAAYLCEEAHRRDAELAPYTHAIRVTTPLSPPTLPPSPKDAFVGFECLDTGKRFATLDMVNSPPHYTDGGIETIDYIEAKLSAEELHGYIIGNVLKYVSRAGKKGDTTEDLRKAKWYLDRLLSSQPN